MQCITKCKQLNIYIVDYWLEHFITRSLIGIQFNDFPRLNNYIYLINDSSVLLDHKQSYI